MGLLPDVSKWSKEKRLSVAIGLSLVFMLGELVGGLWANSLAILSDAAHLLTDVAGFGIALAATVMAKRPGSAKFSFGFGRAEILGAGLSILTLWVLTGWLLVEASARVLQWANGEMEPVDGKLMTIVAVLGVCINLCLALVFMDEHESSSFHSHEGHDHDHGHGHGHGHGEVEGGACGGHGHDVEMGSTALALETSPLLGVTGSKSVSSEDHGHDHDHGHSHAHEHEKKDEASKGGHDHSHGHSSHGTTAPQGGDPSCDSPVVPTDAPRDLNMSAAYAHVLADLTQSSGVVLAGCIIWWQPTWLIIDPICTFCFGYLVLKSTMTLSQQVSNILFEGVPEHIDYEDVRGKLRAIKGVTGTHDLHIWSLSSTSVALSCHIMVDMTLLSASDAIRLANDVCSAVGVDHVTIQVEDQRLHSGECPTANENHMCMAD